MRHVIEFEDESIAEVLHMYDCAGNEIFTRIGADAIVAQISPTQVVHGHVEDHEGIHPVH